MLEGIQAILWTPQGTLRKPSLPQPMWTARGRRSSERSTIPTLSWPLPMLQQRIRHLRAGRLLSQGMKGLVQEGVEPQAEEEKQRGRCRHHSSWASGSKCRTKAQ